MIAQRGNPSLLKAIREGASKVSHMNGVSDGSLGTVHHEDTSYIPRRESHAVPLNEDAIMGQIQNMSGQASQTRQIGLTPANQVPLMTQPSVSTNRQQSYRVQESVPYNFQKKLLDRLTESVETVADTKEYFNATSSLFTLYAMGKLNESVLNKINEEDLREIRGIIREFKGILDRF